MLRIQPIRRIPLFEFEGTCICEAILILLLYVSRDSDQDFPSGETIYFTSGIYIVLLIILALLNLTLYKSINV